MNTDANTQSPALLPTLPFELEALSRARRYQAWLYETVAPFLGSRILEIGSGVGNLSQWLPIRDRLILTETDPQLFLRLEQTMRSRADAASQAERVSVRSWDILLGDLEGLVAEGLDTIVSFNVFEHLPDDRLALSRLTEILRRGGARSPLRIVTLVPGHSWAYGTMDQTFGHFRRYSASSLRKLAQDVIPEAKVHTGYLNAFGLAGWVFQGRVLKKRSFGFGAVDTFEKLCPLIRPVDTFLHQLGLPLGQSVYSVIEL